MKPNKSFFLSRLASIIIDLSAIYCLSILIQALLSKFIFVELSILFIACFLSYYTLCNWLSNGRTPGKTLTGIKVIRTDGGDIQWSDITLREIVLKGIAGIILPVYYFEYLIGKSSSIIAIFIFVILFSLSTLILLIFKRQWWEIFSKTASSVKFLSARTSVKRTFAFLAITAMAGIAVIVYPVLAGNKKNFLTTFYPVYPVNNETIKYAAFIKSNSQYPVDYIFNLFKKYDIVVISERLHPEYTQYQLFSDIVKDKRFSKNIGNIFTECGSVSFQDTLNKYLHTSFASEDLLNRSTASLQRNSSAIWPLWDNTNLFDFFKTINKLNHSLPDSSKLNWYFTDTEVDWTNMTHAKFIKAYTNPRRDSLMAAHIIQKYKDIIAKQGRKKALVIMNSRHGYGLIPGKFAKGFRSEYNEGTTAYLMKELPGKVANVLMNTVSIKYATLFTPIQHGKWETAFSISGNRDAGFNFSGSPFGDDEFDPAFLTTPGLTYKDVFTGFIFYKPLNKQIKEEGFPYEFTNFEDTILKRAAYVNPSEVESFKSQIASEKQYPDPVDSEIIPYAFFSNLLLVVIIPSLITLSFLLAFFLFRRQLSNNT